MSIINNDTSFINIILLLPDFPNINNIKRLFCNLFDNRRTLPVIDSAPSDVNIRLSEFDL